MDSEHNTEKPNSETWVGGPLESKNVIVLHIIGQSLSIPTNLFSTIMVLGVVIGITTAWWFALINPEGARNVIQELNGVNIEAGRDMAGSKVEEKVIVRLWTPAVETHKYIVKHFEGQSPKTDAEKKLFQRMESKYYYVENDEILIQFGKRLRDDLGAEGFSRWKVFGAGSTSLKPGWMWDLTFAGNSTINRQKIKGLYEEVFQKGSGIYISISRPMKPKE